jgi:hypothetical protein
MSIRGHTQFCQPAGMAMMVTMRAMQDNNH